MPFKDIATSDTILMRELPPSSDAAGRRAIRRLQEVGVNVIAPAAVLAADPLPGGVAMHTLRDAVAAHNAGGLKLPQVCGCECAWVHACACGWLGGWVGALQRECGCVFNQSVRDHLSV